MTGVFRRVWGSGCFLDSSPYVLPDTASTNESAPEYGVDVLISVRMMIMTKGKQSF